MNVFIIAAITADGLIAEHAEHISTAWTSKEDRQWFSQRTKQAGVMVMGAKTFATLNRALPGRLTMVYTHTIPEVNPFDETQVQYTKAEPKALVEQLKQKNYSEIAICGGSSIYSMFMKSGLVTKLYLTIEPKLFGKGIGLFSKEMDVDLKLIAVKPLSESSVLLEYDVLNPGSAGR